MIRGPFYVKNGDGAFELCENCRNCCFESEEVCYSVPCTYFWDSNGEAESDDPEED